MNELNNDEVRLFDHTKKLTFSGCPDSSLDGIGSDLLSDDFLKDENGMSRTDVAGTFPDPLLIINNELSSQRQITLDDVVDLDLSSLSTLENNGNPQESLGFNDFLSEGSFCLNSLTDKMSEPDKHLGFGNFDDIRSDQSLCKIQGKEFKIVPTYVDGKLTNTLHLEDDIGNPQKLFDEVSSATAGLVASADCLAASSSEKITASIEDFPTLSLVTGGDTLTLNGQVQPTGRSLTLNGHIETVVSHVNHNGEPITDLSHSEVDPDISDLIKVKPKVPKKKKPIKSSLASIKKKKQKKRERQINKLAAAAAAANTGQDKNSTEINGLSGAINKSGTIVTPTLISDTNLISHEPLPKNGIPKFKIVQLIEPSTVGDTLPTASSSRFSNGSMFLTAADSTTPTATAVVTSAAKLTQQQLIESLQLYPLGQEESSKCAKQVTDNKPGDMPNGNQGLSQTQKQQIAVILKQREALKRATGSSSNKPKRNESKIICKVFCPEDFFEAKPSHGLSKGEAAKDEGASKGTDDAKTNDLPPKAKKAKNVKSKHPHLNEEFKWEAGLRLAPSVTRSGRTSRPPKKLIKRDGKLSSTVNLEVDEHKEPAVFASTPLEGSDVKAKPELLEGLPAKKKLSKKPANNYTCPSCNKTYVDVKVYVKHLENHEGNNEIPPPPPIILPPLNQAPVRPKKRCKCKCKNSENCRARVMSFKKMVNTISEKEFIKTCGPRLVKTTSVWDFLLLRIRTINKFEDYVKGLLSELGKLWDELKAASTKILFPCDHPSETTVTIEDRTTCEVLGVPKGVYQTFPSGLEMPVSSVANDDQPQPEPADSQPSILAPPDTKEDISQSSLLSDILCDKSGMDTVDQLVSERLKTLAPGDDMLDPPSDDLMTSLLNCHSNSLSDSMFNPLVSGSNDDLLKALENLSNPIPPPLDFTALTNEYPDR